MKHTPEILTGLGIAGMAATTVIAVRATPKAIELIEEKKREEGVEKLKPAEIVKTTWKCYIPAAVTGATSVGCLLGASSVNARRNAALAAAYNISTTALTEYKDKVVETIGEKKERDIREAISADKVKNDPVTNREVIMTGKDVTLCYDAVFGRYFKSDIDTINRAVDYINRQVVAHGYVSLNEFYEEIGLPPIEIGYDLGWSFDDGHIDVIPDSELASDGTPCRVITYNVTPRYEFSKFS